MGPEQDCVGALQEGQQRGQTVQLCKLGFSGALSCNCSDIEGEREGETDGGTLLPRERERNDTLCCECT